jgi:hypothetical protein
LCLNAPLILMTRADERRYSAPPEVIERQALPNGRSDTGFESLHGLLDRCNVRAAVTKDEAAAGGSV